VIDLAAADGGNCELTDVAGPVEHGGVRILPGHDFPSRCPARPAPCTPATSPRSASCWSTTGELDLDLDDEVVAGALLTHDGRGRRTNGPPSCSTGGDA
jgi:H+-translocating NAD(P) transhydrogenase subunit alpha